jgi:LacI family transcriptional regulator
LALLSDPQPPTAFVCLGTRILSGVLQGLRHAGRTVPDDASVVSIGDTDLSQLFSPAITSLTWDLDAVGHALAERLLRQLGADAAHEPERIVMTTQLVLRESCAPLHQPAAARRKAVRS